MKAKCCITFIVLASMLGWVAVTVSAANGAGDGKSRGAGGSIQSHSGMSIHHARQGDPASEFKVANIVILNNTGLPDSEVYFCMRNTILDTTDTNCNPDMLSLFQWYGGTDTLPPTQITGDFYTTDSNYHKYMSLQDMRGYVASNATSLTSVVNNNHTYWNNKTYSQLLPNYPSSDTTPVAGQFPTISLGLWGACTLDDVKKQYAGRMMITTGKPTPTDVRDGFTEPAASSTYSPFLMIEGSINPTDKGTYPSGSNQYPVNASNFDLSYVDQFSMGANMELWGTNASLYGPLPSESYHTGKGLKMDENCSSTFYTNKFHLTSTASTLAGATNYSSWSNTPKPTSSNPYLLEPFINYLINATTTSTVGVRVPVLKVASYLGLNFAGSPGFLYPAFQDNSYTTPKEYKFASYFVNVDTDVKWWTTIKNQFYSDTGLDPLPTTPPTLITTPNSDTSGEWMIMVGKMSNGANPQTLVNTNGTSNPESNYPVAFNPNGGNGPVSIQFDAKISMNMSGSNSCTDVQTNGLAACPAGDSCSCPPSPNVMFNTLYYNGTDCNISTSTSESLGINFSMTADEFTLSEFDLAAGLTTSATSGILDVILVAVDNNNIETNLNKLTLTLPNSADVGLASLVVGPNNRFGNMPLQINWQAGTCNFKPNSNTSIPLATKCYLPANAGWGQPITPGTTTAWKNNLKLSASLSTSNPTLSGYRLYLSGTNMTVALSNGTPTGATGSVILPFVKGSYNSNYYSNQQFTDIACSTNHWLACTITAVPAESDATTDLHVLAVPKYNLISYSNGILGNNPSYQFLRYNNSAWETSTSPDSNSSWYNGISKAIVNDVSGRIVGDAMALFSFGVVNSTKLGSAFPTTTWPSTAFPPDTTAIGALTSGQYFHLMSLQDNTNPNNKLPAGINLATTINSSGTPLVSYDSYFDVAFNQCHTNTYFTGLGDRFGGSINPNPGFSMDVPTVQTGGSGSSALLGFIPGQPAPDQPVIVITLHPIYIVTAWDTIDSDLDNDLDTDSTDLSLMLLAMSVYPPAPETGSEDLNKDGVLDNTDLGLVFLHFGD